ncbi:Virulence factors putative positive transcription regulator BvgA [compost metagenome]
MRALLEKAGHKIVGETDNGVDAVSMAKQLMPELVILDIGIPRLDGMEVIKRLVTLALPLKILVLSGQSAALFAARCIQAGAAGFVCKQEGLSGLTSAVNAVVSGYNYYPSALLRARPDNGASTPDQEMIERLSHREMTVLKYLANGHSNQDIGEQMYISNKTVSTYKTRLLMKLNARSLVDLIDFAKRNALV